VLEIAFVAEELAEQVFGHPSQRSAIIDVTWGEVNRQQLTQIVDDQVQLESKPAHRVFCPCS